MKAALVRASRATLRIDRATSWLAAQAREPRCSSSRRPPMPRRPAAQRRGCARRGLRWHRATLARLASQLATPVLAERGLAPLGGLAADALAARVLHGLRAQGGLGRFAAVADGPGLARAFARTLAELRMARVESGALAATAPDLVPIAAAWAAELANVGLADRAEIFRIAAEVARDSASRAALLGLPTLLLDVAIESAAERDFVAALATRAPSLLATLRAATKQAPPHSAPRSQRRSTRSKRRRGGALARLQRHLFEGDAESEAAADDSVVVLSAPGESRECVEIARRCLHLAATGVRSTGSPCCCARPTNTARTSTRPSAARAFRRTSRAAPCSRSRRSRVPRARRVRAERLSARRFAEYLSLGEVPDATAAGEPPRRLRRRPLGATRRGAGARGGRRRARRGAARDTAAGRRSGSRRAAGGGGVLRAPRRWEQLLVDAAVIGGRDRWERRLAGLAADLAQQLARPRRRTRRRRRAATAPHASRSRGAARLRAAARRRARGAAFVGAVAGVDRGVGRARDACAAAARSGARVLAELASCKRSAQRAGGERSPSR